jgi:hypothetical protein
MRYRIAQIGLMLLGIFLFMESLNLELPVPPGHTTSYFLNMNGFHLLVGILAVLCFYGAWRVGKNAKRAKT